MSVLRRAKLRTPDGTESIEYPLGVEAENVEVANQENLSQRLVRIDEDLEKNEEDIAAVSELAGTNKQNIGANEIRIDALERRSVSIEQKPYYFNTVADMKAYQELKVGDMTVTLGYYSVNDGGGATYQIVNNNSLVDDGGSVHDLTNGLKAKLIIKDRINVKQFGAKGDGVTDDTQKIQLAINSDSNVLIPKGVFMISQLTLQTNSNLFGLSSDSILKSLENNQSTNLLVNTSTSSKLKIHDLCLDGNKYNTTNETNGIYLDRENGTYDYELDPKYYIYNIIFKDIAGDAIILNRNCRDTLIRNVWIVNAKGRGIYNIASTDVKIVDSTIGGTGKEGVYLAHSAGANMLDNIKIYYTGYEDDTCAGCRITSDSNSITNLYIQETIYDGLLVEGSLNNITGLTVDSVGRVLNGNNTAASAIKLSPFDINYLVRENYITGSIHNGNVNSYARYGVFVNNLYSFYNYINVSCNNVKYNTTFFKSMKKYEKTNLNHTNTIIVSHSIETDSPTLENVLQSATGIYFNKSYTDISYNSDVTNNIFTITFPDVKTKGNANSTYANGILALKTQASNFSNLTGAIASCKAKISSPYFKVQLIFRITYNNGQVANIIFNKNDIFENRFEEYDEIVSYIDFSKYSNPTKLDLWVYALIDNNNQFSSINDVIASFKDIKYIEW